MRNVVAGAGAAVLLGLVTGLVGWRWPGLLPRRLTRPSALLANSNSTGNQSRHDDPESRFKTVNVTSYFNDTSIISSTLPPVKEGFESVIGGNSSSFINATFSDDSPENFTTEELTTGFFNESSALSSLLQDNNNTEDIDYVKMGEELVTEATTILDTGIWDFERRTEDGDAIFSRQLDNGNMVYRLTGIVDMPPQDLLVIIWDGLPDYPKWNPSLLECRVLEKINDQTDISYTVSAPGARGYVASRDFVSLRHWELRHNTYIAASKSIDFAGVPSNPDYIRGKNGPGCMELRPLSSDPSKTEFRWLLNTKLNGWIPSYIADKAYKKFMTKYMILLRDYCKIIKQRATNFTLSSTTPRNITE